MWFKRWWRWATNPPPLTHQYWFVDNIGVVQILSVSYTWNKLDVQRLKDTEKPLTVFEINLSDFLQSATPINTCLTFNRNILGFEDKSQVQLVERLKAAYKEVASP